MDAIGVRDPSSIVWRAHRTKLPDGHIREAQHSPPFLLARVFATELTKVAETMDQLVQGSGDHFKAAGERFEKAVKNSGGLLPAILIHQQTHTRAGAPGPRIHGSEIEADLWNELGGFGLTKAQLLLLKGGNLAVKAQMEHHTEHLDRRANQIGGQNFRPAMLTKSAQKIIKNVYRMVAVQSMTATTLAIRASVVDGPLDKREQ